MFCFSIDTSAILFLVISICMNDQASKLKLKRTPPIELNGCEKYSSLAFLLPCYYSHGPACHQSQNTHFRWEAYGKGLHLAGLKLCVLKTYWGVALDDGQPGVLVSTGRLNPFSNAREDSKWTFWGTFYLPYDTDLLVIVLSMPLLFFISFDTLLFIIFSLPFSFHYLIFLIFCICVYANICVCIQNKIWINKNL